MTATAHEAGHQVTYLGPNLPAEEIAAATRALHADSVGLSIVYRADDEQLPRELRKLRRYLGDDTTLLVGGRAAAAYAPVLAEIGAIQLRDLAHLRSHLGSPRG